MKTLRILAVILAAALLLAGCLVVAPTPAPTATTAPSLTPDVYATSAASTLEALAATATAQQETLLALTTTPTLVTGEASATPGPATLPPTITPIPTTGGSLIARFSADPAEIDPGDSITLSWSASGDTATLYSLLRTGQLGSFWNVPLTGSRVVETDPGTRGWVSYMLFVQQGDTIQSAQVTVTVRCPDTWFFAPAPELCPQTPAITAAGAYQPFERGMMFWVGALDRIIVLFDDGSYPLAAQMPDEWEEGMPESDPALTPPAGLYQPVRGFGLVWRTESPYLSIRERLGWATQPESGYTASYQCDSAPKYNTCYLSMPDSRVLVLEPENSGWYIWE
jgi:hypothetical protein